MDGLLSIGEVAKKVGVASHTIRFWTEEFAEYIPFEVGKGERRYYPENALKIFEKINHLIHNEGVKIRIIKEKKLLLNPTSNSKLTDLKNILEEVLEKLNQI
jgi:DNA-binding transcriptional MerR regulator